MYTVQGFDYLNILGLSIEVQTGLDYFGRSVDLLW